jgi:hypothetical protein
VPAALGSSGGLPSTAGLRLLPWAASGVDVVPGVPARVRRLADELEAVARGLALMRGLVAGLPRGDWWGPAAGLCDQLLQQQPGRYDDAARAMSSCASALRSHAAVLEAAQARADEAVRLDLMAATATRRWLDSSPGARVGESGDPGVAARHQVREQVAAVRQQVLGSAASTAGCLRAGARRAPERPAFVRRAARTVFGFGQGVREGLTETVVDTLSLAARFSSVRLVADPGGYLTDLRALGAGAAHGVAHPGELVAAVADADTLQHDPARWVGHLLPDAVLAVGTAGALPVAERSATVATRIAARVGPSGVRAPLRAAVAAQTGAGRAPIRLRDLRAYESAPDAFGHRTQLTPVDHAVARRVLRDSAWAEQRMTPRLTTVAREVDAWLGPAHRDVGLHGIDHALKGPDSLKRKLALDGVTKGGAVPALAPRVNDTVRYTLTVPHGAYVESAAYATDRMADQGFRLTAAKSFWRSDRYRGLNLTFHDPVTGRPFELQVHTPDSWDATVATHPDYEKFRSPAIPWRLKEFFRRRIEARFSTVPVPDGVDRLSTLLPVSGDQALMTTPSLRTLVHPGTGLPISTGVRTGRSLACDDDE